ncbi:polysaccharide biosynthesis/export family protein [Planctomycetes bacterium K23_9]|uniref:SLBB domain protein n=1 Tax=Stieleria marina TaxID=1930275 RepID=A0A517NRI7_9BACT|nr:SLBB domain protein [Planctomycetes bacterium K23_9]
MFRTLLLIVCTIGACGCSTLGITLYPTGHFLTEQSEQVLERSPREANLPKELSKGVLPVHYLEPGDVLLIEPIDFESNIRIPADQHVLADGSVDLGGFGRAVIAGLTLEAAEQLIEQTIVHSGAKETQINIRLLEGVHRFYVLGEVNSPGAYPLAGNETVLDAILTAGGLTGDASPCKLLLARPTLERSCRITLPICYREITQLGDSSTNYQLQPGDRIFVASRTFCEELKCCLANETCERCCKCQSPCRDPSLVQNGNPYQRVAPERAAATWNPRNNDTASGGKSGTKNGEANSTAKELANPLSDATPTVDSALGQDAPPIRRMPMPFSDAEQSLNLTNPEMLDSDVPAVSNALDGQLLPSIHPPSIPDNFDPQQ